MIEMRWVWHDLKNGAPPTGSICVGDRSYQKLQYRYKEQNPILPMAYIPWSEWQDVAPPSVTA
jgi:hypothetical protein